MKPKPQIRHQEIAASVITTMVGSIPIAGTLIQEGLFNYWGRVKQARINLFVEGLKEYFETLQNEDIDPEFLRSEDFAQVFELVIRKVAENKAEEKLKYFKNVLVNNIRTKTVHDFSETFLNLVSQLHMHQLDILKNHTKINYDYLKARQKIHNIPDGHLNLPANEEAYHVFKNNSALFSAEQYEFYINDLESKCLVETRRDSIGAMGPADLIYITHFGRELLKFIENS